MLLPRCCSYVLRNYLHSKQLATAHRPKKQDKTLNKKSGPIMPPRNTVIICNDNLPAHSDVAKQPPTSSRKNEQEEKDSTCDKQRQTSTKPAVLIQTKPIKVPKYDNNNHQNQGCHNLSTNSLPGSRSPFPLSLSLTFLLKPPTKSVNLNLPPSLLAGLCGGGTGPARSGVLSNE